MKKMLVNQLILDFDLYPRASVDSQHIGYMVEALAAGHSLPPVVIDAKTKKVIDGFHRCRAYLRFYGENAEIEVEERRYPDERAAFLDAMALNANHGKALDRHDRTHCGILAKSLKIPRDAVAQALSMSAKQFAKLLDERLATSRGTGEELALKGTFRDVLSGKALTKEQIEVNRRSSGMQQVFYVNQVLGFVKTPGMLDKENEKLMERLEELHGALGELFASK